MSTPFDIFGVIETTGLKLVAALYLPAGLVTLAGSTILGTTFGPAEPHCPNCGRDFMHEWKNDRFGELAVCMWCLTEEMGERSWIRKSAEVEPA